MVGGSLAGLMSALTLARSGMAVTVLERHGPKPGNGGVLMTNDGLLEKLTGWNSTPGGAPTPAHLPGGFHSWGAIHDALRDTAAADERITLHHHTRIASADQDTRRAWATTDEGKRFEADVVIGGDGHRSVVRAAVAPHRPHAAFAGYVIWIGFPRESSLPPRVRKDRRIGQGAFLHSDNGILFGNYMPDEDGRPNDLQVGVGWYDNTHNAFLRQNGNVRDGVVHHSVTPDQVPDRVWDELARLARKDWPAPWADVLLAAIEQRALTGIPIAEYVPDRLVNGRIAIVGNAAHVPTPMTGSGFSESVSDAEALAEAVAEGFVPDHAATALERYELARLRRARSVVESGKSFSSSFRIDR